MNKDELDKIVESYRALGRRVDRTTRVIQVLCWLVWILTAFVFMIDAVGIWKLIFWKHQ